MGHQISVHQTALPELNGKVERPNAPCLEEFWSWVEPNAQDLEQQLQEWQHHYNWERPHSVLGGDTPIDRCCDLIAKTPLRDEVDANFNATDERSHVQHVYQPSPRAILKTVLTMILQSNHSDQLSM